jgi:hypothetical protein
MEASTAGALAGAVVAARVGHWISVPLIQCVSKPH